MQPFLMMKQTLDSAFDPGPLLLYGANVKVTEYLQMFSRGKAKHDVVDRFTVSMAVDDKFREVTFGTPTGSLEIELDVTGIGSDRVEISNPLTPGQRKSLTERYKSQAASYVDFFKREGNDVSWQPAAYRNRCFLEPHIELKADRASYRLPMPLEEDEQLWVDLLRGIIHVPGLRGNPERAYQRSAVGSTYPGTFDTYVADILFEWSEKSPDRLTQLAGDLESLGLTWKVMARRLNDASVELLVGRMPHAQQGGAFDLVSVADVGFGVSQTLPVLVALRAARAGQIVYVEQPEIHLHPRAQLALAETLVAAAKRGVRVIAETHSSLLIRGIQTAVARKRISPSDLSLNWFTRDEVDGSQRITVAELDDAGRFGDWPVDFDDISQEADWAFLEAIEGPR